MLLQAWTSYKLRSDSLEELMAYISTNLPRRLREVLDYQPTKHNQLADIRRSGMPNPIAETHPVSLFVPLGIPGTKVFNPNSWPRTTPLESQINLNQMSPSLLERRYHQDSTHGTLTICWRNFWYCSRTGNSLPLYHSDIRLLSTTLCSKQFRIRCASSCLCIPAAV